MIALLLLAALSACAAEEIGQHIVGGDDANYGDHPYICSLQYRSGSTWYHICGCVVYGNRKIITAAHCLGNAPTSYRVVVGNHRMSATDAYQVTYNIDSYTMHPNYNGNAAGYPNDIACMKTANTIGMNTHVNTINFDSGNSWAGQSCTLSGWGRLSGGGSLADTLQRLSLTKITNTDCAARWSGISGATINSNHICFYRGTGYSSCNGDSGGPARCGNTLVGVTSWGISNCSGSYPSVYTRVAGYKGFLDSNCN